MSIGLLQHSRTRFNRENTVVSEFLSNMHFLLNPLFTLITALAVHCSAAATGKARTYTYTIHEHGAETLDQWDKDGYVSKQESVPVQIGLTQNNLEKGHDMLMDV